MKYIEFAFVKKKNYICIRLICHRLKETHITLNYLSSHLLLTIKGCMSFLQTMTNFDSSKNKTKSKSFNLKHIQIYQNKLYTFKIKYGLSKNRTSHKKFFKSLSYIVNGTMEDT
jgi:hypothetical protein